MKTPPLTVVVHLGDQRRSRTDSHGIINFSLGLTRALPSVLHADERLVVVANEEIAAELGDRWRRPVDEVRVVPAPRSTLARLAIDHRTLPAMAATAGADVVVYPKGFLPARPRALRRHRQVACFHDAIPHRQRRDRSLPTARRIRAAYFSLLLRWSMQRADARLFVSDFSARELRGGTAPEPFDTVIGEGISLPPQPYRPLREREPQAVVLASRHPHKRIGPGLALLADDPRCRAQLRRVVVLGDGAVPAITGLAVERVPGPVSAPALAVLLAASRLLVFPSSYEGFGLPPIEALAMGTPVVYRRTDAAREVLGDLPGGFDREEPGDFGSAVGRALDLDDDALRAHREEMWRRFDWTATAQRLVDVLRGVTRRPRDMRRNGGLAPGEL